MNVRPGWRTLAAVGAAFVVGLTAPAGADAVRTLAHKIDGSSIKKDSMPGNRITSDSVTGKQISESTLGHVPYATKAGTAAKLPPLEWHKLTLLHGWTNLLGDRTPAYAIDAQGLVHLAGAMCCGTDSHAFTLPDAARPDTNVFLVVLAASGYTAQLVVQPSGKVISQSGAAAPPNNNTALTSMDGVTFAPGTP